MTLSPRQTCHASDKFVYQFLQRRAKPASMMAILTLSLTSLCALLFVAAPAWARPPTESDLLAGTMTADEVGEFFEKLPNKPSNVAIFDVKINAPLDPSFAEALEGEVVRVLREGKAITVMNCFECRAPHLEVREDKIVVKKGMPDQAALASLGKQLGVDSFLTIEVFRTQFSLVTQIKLMQASDGTILGTRQIKIPALDWSEAGLQILTGVGPSLVGGGTGSGDSSAGFSYGGHVAFLEEIGFGKAGLIAGGVGGPKGALLYVTPSVAWRGRFGSYGIYSLKTLGVGFGTSDNVGGIAARIDYTLLLGSFTMMGADLVAMAPIGTNGNQQPVNTALTVYIGFSLGR